jgi:hypothetical protein
MHGSHRINTNALASQSSYTLPLTDKVSSMQKETFFTTPYSASRQNQDDEGARATSHEYSGIPTAVSHPKTTFGPNEMLLCTQFVYDASN